MAKYIFTASNGLLVVKLKNIASEFTNDESLSYKGSSVQQFGSKIFLYDFGLLQKDFRFSDIETINGAVPTDITNAYNLLLALVPLSSGATSLVEDGVAANGDAGVFTLGVRRDVLTVSTSATGKYSEMATDKYSNLLIKDQTRHKRTYSFAFTVAPAAAATDIFQLIGSATTTVSINKINISGTQTTGGQVTVIVSKRSSANTLGTLSTATIVSHDAVDASATAVASVYTANPTSGTAIGDLRRFSLPLGTATATTNNIVQLDFGERGKPIVLSGVSQAIAISLGGVTLTGSSINVWVEITEE